MYGLARVLTACPLSLQRVAMSGMYGCVWLRAELGKKWGGGMDGYGVNRDEGCKTEGGCIDSLAELKAWSPLDHVYTGEVARAASFEQIATIVLTSMVGMAVGVEGKLRARAA
jgi:hypothetical protein